MEKFELAAKYFISAIDNQVPVDVVSDVDSMVHGSYINAWDALRISFQLGKMNELADLCNDHRLREIKNLLLY